MKKVLRLTLAPVLLLTICGYCPAQALRDYADKIGILVGTAVDPRLFTEEAYAATIAREFNMIEPENVMKWAAIRASRDSFNFKPGDAVVAFARAHNMKVRGHCLVWQKYNPAWLAKGKFTPEELSRLMREHIETVVKHYAGQVFAWDVVNESFDASGGLEHSIWYDRPGIGLAGKGTAYIEQAFRWAREADPKALLFYNDYDAEGLNAKSDAIYSMAKDFKERGVPLDGVGLQMHIFNLSMKEIESLEANIKRLTALGLQVHITEMDVGLPVNADGLVRNQSDLQRQADIYRFVANACLRHKGCTAFQTWGFTDKYTWIPQYTKGRLGAPLIFDKDYAIKPSYKAVLDAFREQAR
ncbi:MAG: endo-1,4-beta-xylanase [Acidobacteriota bacterium]|nr:endo-1,4-beta-xylanase [Acidobacteriota bacterium]